MIIDDNEADQFLTKLIVEEFDSNIESLQAYDGQEALDILSKLPKQPSVILLDINMPRMDGHEFLHEYTQWTEQTAVVVMLTSSDQEQDKEKSLSYKCVKQYITKPLKPTALETILN